MKEKMENRLKELQEAQQKDVQTLNSLAKALDDLKQNITVRSGRIAELQEMLNPEEEEEQEESD